MRTWIALIGYWFVPSLAAALGPAAPAGSEFQVNTHTTFLQGFPSIAADSAGAFVVVWESSGQDAPAGYGIFGQRYSPAGARLGTEFQINTYTPGDQGFGYTTVDVASTPDGRFSVVWAQVGPVTTMTHVYCRLYDSSGAPQGAAFRVSNYITSSQTTTSVARAPDGSFLVAWTDDGERDGSSFGVFAHRFSSSGAAVGNDFQLSTYTVGVQGDFGPRLTARADGSFVALWSSDGQDGSATGVFGRLFDSSGIGLGAEFQVNAYTFGAQTWPSAASDADGDFVVAWSGIGDGSSLCVRARRFDSSGVAVGTEFQVNTHTEGYQYPFKKSVFSDADGRFTIVWTDQTNDGGARGVFGQQYDSDGLPLGGEFQVNTYTVGNENIAAIAGGSSGNFAVAWQSLGQDGSDRGVFAQRFQITALPTDTPAPTATPTRTDTPDVSATPTSTPSITPTAKCPPAKDNGCTSGFAKGALLVKQDVPGHEKLIAKMVKGPALAQTDLGNPLNSGGTVYSLCVYDDAGNLAGGVGASVVVDRAGDTCGSTACWSAVGGNPPGGKGYKYLDGALAADGVLKIFFKGGGAGKSKVIVKGKGPNLPDGIPAALQTTTFATVQLRASDGICLSVAVDDIAKQTAVFFKAKFAAP